MTFKAGWLVFPHDRSSTLFRRNTLTWYRRHSAEVYRMNEYGRYILWISVSVWYLPWGQYIKCLLFISWLYCWIYRQQFFRLWNPKKMKNTHTPLRCSQFCLNSTWTWQCFHRKYSSSGKHECVWAVMTIWPIISHQDWTRNTHVNVTSTLYSMYPNTSNIKHIIRMLCYSNRFMCFKQTNKLKANMLSNIPCNKRENGRTVIQDQASYSVQDRSRNYTFI